MGVLPLSVAGNTLLFIVWLGTTFTWCRFAFRVYFAPPSLTAHSMVVQVVHGRQDGGLPGGGAAAAPRRRPGQGPHLPGACDPEGALLCSHEHHIWTCFTDCLLI